MSVEEEIARTLHAGIVKAAREDRIIIEVFDETPGFDFELDLAKSLSPLLNRLRAEAWRQGHAAGRDYRGDGWNCDAHDPEGDNPYIEQNTESEKS